MQIVYLADGTRLKRPASEFHYHEDHQHMLWHDFSRDQVWTLLADGSFDRVRASSSKIGFCLLDIAPYEKPGGVEGSLGLADAPTQPSFTSCDWRPHGLPVGWYDIYRAYISGQSLHISHMEDGLYALISTVDPTHKLREANESNRSNVIYFQLQGDQITLLGEILGQSTP